MTQIPLLAYQINTYSTTHTHTKKKKKKKLCYSTIISIISLLIDNIKYVRTRLDNVDDHKLIKINKLLMHG
jgi:hypothetical protein